MESWCTHVRHVDRQCKLKFQTSSQDLNLYLFLRDMVPDLSVKLFVQVFILRLCYFQPPFCGDSRKKTIDKAG